MLFLTVATVHIVTPMSPGPNFFFASQTAIGRSRKETMMGMLGITYGIMVWAGITLPGLHLIIKEVAWLHALVMMSGGLYLCWMGYQMLRSTLKKEVVPTPAPQVELAKNGRNFLKGLLTNLTNPKTITYFDSVLPLFVDDNVGTIAHWGIFALIIVGTLAWFIVVVSLFTLPQTRRGYQRPTKWINGFTGALFAGFGIHLVVSR